MKDLIHFFKSLIILGLIVLAFVIILPKIFAPIISDDSQFLASNIDKQNRLKSIKAPKIVLIGGSGTAYSVDSKLIQDSLNRPVVNMAIAYGLGLHYMVEEAAPYIGKGDIVVLLNEYYLPKQGNTKLLTLLNDINPATYNYLNFSLVEWLKFRVVNFQRVGSSLFYYFKNSDEKDPTKFRKSFNNNGDMIGHLQLPNARPLKDVEDLDEKDYIAEIEIMNTLSAICKERGAAIFYNYPAYPDTEYKKNKKGILFFEKQLKAKFNGEILSKPIDNIYPDSDFFDTIYHLNIDGRQKRSQFLQEKLKALL